ncbi:MAG: tyrosinase family protein [Saprospiraceae bacterium]|uniref:Tyrosinase family protein n=1 Tax=Candidatus Defluviibacterium haderslevense TaxID=2981993 RepID=A0A9D7XJ82_9BACT|nr:tyrosinase family protein [Candidatus Defluviibacterium haderslevense]
MNEIHLRTSFHPWHRIFNMHLERELQAIIPYVTIPYWKFDEKAERVFTSKFIGETERSDGASQEKPPKFNKMNPLVNYIEHTVWGTLQRAYRDRNPANQDTFEETNGKRDVLTEKRIVNGPDSFESWATFEEYKSHNRAHNVFTGLVADVGKDPIDPLFFMMHSNVDRLWAKWQQTYNRFDGNQNETYPHQKKYTGKRGEEWVKEWAQNASEEDLKSFNDAGFYRVTNKDIGNYAEDTLWPWGMDFVLSRPMRKWSENWDSEVGRVPQIEIEFPKSATSNYPSGPITVKSAIDYQDRLNNKTHLGFDYDDIPYFDHDRKPSTDIAMEHLKDNDQFQKNPKKHNSALLILNNKKNNLAVRLNVIGSIDETSEVFLDTILDIIADPSDPAELKAELINEMLAAKRANRFFPSKKSRFFNQLRGLIKDNNKNLRLQAIDILASSEDPVVQEFLIEEIKKEKSDFISAPDAIFFLRQSPKPQHAKLFIELFNQSKDTNVRKSAIAGLGNDPGSLELLKKVVLDGNEDFKIREASALSLHNLNHEMMNDLATEILINPESSDGIKLFRSSIPNADEVDFKAGLLNMLTFTGDLNKLKGNNELKATLNEVIEQSPENRSNFKSSIEVFSTEVLSGPTILEQMASKLLDRIK